jgi:hypothetical protein
MSTSQGITKMADFFDFFEEKVEQEDGPEFITRARSEEEIEKWSTDPDFTEVSKAVHLLKKQNVFQKEFVLFRLDRILLEPEAVRKVVPLIIAELESWDDSL